MKSKKIIILVSIIAILISIIGLYTTYAINVKTEQTTPNQYDMAFNFELSENVTRQLTVETGKTKVFDIDITNPYEDTVRYGVAYTLISPETMPSGVIIAQASTSKNPTIDSIEANLTKSVSLIVVNNSTESITISFSVINGYKNDEDLTANKDSIGKTLIDEIYEITTSKALETLNKLKLTSYIKSGTPDFSIASCSSKNSCDETNSGIYMAEDDLGDSYYFRGMPENNYVKFGKYTDIYRGYRVDYDDFYEFNTMEECQQDENFNTNCTSMKDKDMYWRIIRINGDGTIRMIYDGTEAHQNGFSTADKSLTTTYTYKSYENHIAYNEYDDDNSYVGYMNGSDGVGLFPNGSSNSTSYEEAHSNISNSTIKNYIDNVWYANTIANTVYEQYLADAIYCNDREVSNSNENYPGDGSGETITLYKAAERLLSATPTPTLRCSQKNDRFTLENSILKTQDEKGTNQKLTYPVGLITTDEVNISGMLYDSDSYSYLSGIETYTMSPMFVNLDATYNRYAVAKVGAISSRSYYTVSGLNSMYDLTMWTTMPGVRPVISLKPNALQYGTGVIGDEFRIEN